MEEDGQYLSSINMVKTRSGLSSIQANQSNQPKEEVKRKKTSRAVKLFSYAFPKKDSPFYVNRQALLPYFQEQYDNIQRKMKDVNKITFRDKDEKKTFTFVNPQPHQMDTNSQSEPFSHASTEIKVDYSQMRECMQQLNQQFGSQFHREYVMDQQSSQKYSQCSYVSSCRSQDIEIQQKIAYTHNQDNEMRQIQSQQQYLRVNNREANAQMFAEPLMHFVEMPSPIQIAAFGPLNIDQLSTNQSLNPHSRSIQLQQPNINHIFIENIQNLFQNLSEISTKACMSHNDNSNGIEAATSQLTQDQFQLLLWNSQNNLHLYRHLGVEQINFKIMNYLNIMLEKKESYTSRILHIEEREQFWSLMTIIGFNLFKDNIERMQKLLGYEQNELQFNDFESYLMKERIQCMKLVPQL